MFPKVACARQALEWRTRNESSRRRCAGGDVEIVVVSSVARHELRKRGSAARWSGGAPALVDEPAEKVDPLDRSAVILQRGGLKRCLQVEASVRAGGVVVLQVDR
jgi:hypothetical protein